MKDFGVFESNGNYPSSEVKYMRYMFITIITRGISQTVGWLCSEQRTT